MTVSVKKNQHLTREMFCDWQEGTLNLQEEELFFKHIGSCTFCAEQFGTWMEEELQEPPAYLKEEIMQRSQLMDVQVVIKAKQTSKQMQLMWYSLRVGLAVVASIFLLTITSSVQNMELQMPVPPEKTQTQEEKRESIADKLNQESSKVTQRLSELANGIFQIERDSSSQEQN